MEKIKEAKTKLKKLLVFHPTIAPYRIAFFNDLSKAFQTIIRLSYRNLRSQSFDYAKIEEKFEFTPRYPSRTVKIFGRRFYLGAVRTIRESKPDIILVSEYGEALWISLITRFFVKNKYKIIVMCDDSKDYAEQCSGFRKLSRDASLRHMDGIILCNDEAEKWYKGRYNVNTVVFPIIQRENDFSENRDEIIQRKEEIIEEFNLLDKRIFLFVGRLAPEKNIEYLIRSFVQQIENYPENTLMILGGESDKAPGFRKLMEKYIAEKNASGNIRFVGRKEGIELRSWYEVGQVLVLPSISEPFGAVVNEALLAGEYVMVSNKAGSACMVTKENGWLLDIAKQYIDFSEPSRIIPALQRNEELRLSKMPYTYREKMNDLIHWLNEIE